MWSRRDLKERAKVSIKKNIWMCIGITFIVSILGGTLGSSMNYNFDISPYNTTMNFEIATIPLLSIAITAGIAIVILFLVSIYNIFICEPLKVGHHRFYLENRDECSHFDALIFVFKSGYYWNVVKTCFLMNLYLVLWTLLLIIPGIYKAYEYQMIPYILAENPSLPTSRVFELSREMTYHQKFDMFILGISFIGWSIVTLFTCGLGMLILNPYIEATQVELYITMRDDLLDRDFAMYDEFPGFAEVV